VTAEYSGTTIPTTAVELGKFGQVFGGDVTLYKGATGVLETGGHMRTANGNLILNTAGNGVTIKEGSNARMGVATLASGTVTVSTTQVTANSRIFLTKNSGTSTGALRVSARTAGTSFTITSSDGADTSTVAWMIVEPA